MLSLLGMIGEWQSPRQGLKRRAHPLERNHSTLSFNTPPVPDLSSTRTDKVPEVAAIAQDSGSFFVAEVAAGGPVKLSPWNTKRSKLW